jgi:multiple antibiotic resistance protein
MLSSAIMLSIAFLALLNPFALFIYLRPVMVGLSGKAFAKVLLQASVISLLIYFIFAVSGIFLFEKILQIKFESFRIFGGLVISALALMVILTGKHALIHIKEDLDDLASEIALPYMVGAGTISLSIIIGNTLPPLASFLVLFFVVSLNYIAVLILKQIREYLPTKFQIAFDKSMGILLRLSAFLIGAIGLNMIMTGIANLFLA